MRNFLMAAAVVTGVGVCTGAFAADYNNYANPFSTKTTAYLNFGFGGSGRNSDILSSLHYGLRMDSANPYVAQANGQPLRPAFVQADFNLHDGFSGAMLNGVRFASHVMSFDEDTGEETSYSLMDWGLLAVGAAALGFGIAEVVKTHDSPDPKSTSTSTVVQTPSGPLTVITNTVTGAVQGVVDAAGLPINLSTVTTPVHDALCSAVAALCYSDSQSNYRNASYMQERDIQRAFAADEQAVADDLERGMGADVLVKEAGQHVPPGAAVVRREHVLAAAGIRVQAVARLFQLVHRQRRARAAHARFQAGVARHEGGPVRAQRAQRVFGTRVRTLVVPGLEQPQIGSEYAQRWCAQGPGAGGFFAREAAFAQRDAAPGGIRPQRQAGADHGRVGGRGVRQRQPGGVAVERDAADAAGRRRKHLGPCGLGDGRGRRRGRIA